MSKLRLFCLFFINILFGTAALAQNGVPDHRFVFTRGVDFYGDDLGKIFDTTQEACARACAAQPACVAFTFNSRSNACFPKSAVTRREFYEGAVSAIKQPTPPQVLARAAGRAADVAYLGAQTRSLAQDLVARTAARFPVDDQPLPEILEALQTVEAQGNILPALRWAGKAVSATDRSDLWLRYARISLRDLSQLSRPDRRRITAEALPAALNAYLRSPDDAARAEALLTLARALEANRRGRDMIPALRLARQVQDSPQITALLDHAVATYGFRVTGHQVDSNAARPRICVQFSEKLVQGAVDYEPYVQATVPGLAVQAEDQQLCLDGVAHGERYGVSLRAGLPAASGEVLQKAVDLQIYVRDRRPAVRFAGRAYVLPRSAEAALPVETVNVDEIDLRLRRISDRNIVRAIRENYFGRPLSKYRDDAFARDLAQEIWTGTGQTRNTLNRDVTTRLPLGEVLADQAPGVFALSASVPGQDPYDFPAATQWFVLSDLGLATWSGVDGLHVSVRGLADAQARAGVTLSLISQANAVLGTARTDAQGFALFPAGLTRGSGAGQPALLMAEQGDSDVAFLPLGDPAFDLSDRGVEGRPPAPPIDTFLTTDRGAYRAGDTIYATVLTRDATAAALTGLPVTAILLRPDGVEHARLLSSTAQAGGHVFTLPLSTDVPRGTWRLDIKTDVDGPALATQRLLIEDFIPDRIALTPSLPDGALSLTDQPTLRVDVQYLFGAPGAGLPVRGEVRVQATRSLTGWDGYLFGPHDQRVQPRVRSLTPATTDAAGQAMIPLLWPEEGSAPTAGQPLSATVTVRVTEGSGRPVERRLTRPLAPVTPLIGVKPGFDGVLAENTQAPFDLIALDRQEGAAPLPVRWTLNKVRTRYQWYQLDGRWRWEPTTRRTRIAVGEVALTQAAQPLNLPVDWGQYELVIESTDAMRTATTSVAFSAGWHGGDAGTDTPDRLRMSLDADTYDAGDTAQLRIMAEGAGTALVSVLSNRVVARKVVAVTAGENRIPLEVTADWGSSAYVTATLLRPMNRQAGENPARSIGLAHAAVRPAGKALAVTLAAPDVTDGQAGSLRVGVQVAGIAAGDTAYVTLAAVDQGILNVTGFQPPDVTGHYFGQRRLGVEMRDVYGRLIDGLNGAMGTVRSGGDAGPNTDLQASPPPSETHMTFFSGPVEIGADGRAEIDVTRPAFNGTVKLMAVVWSAQAVGQASRDVIARDPVVVTASAPRFLAPGDTSRLLLEFTHTTGAAGPMPLTLEAQMGLDLAAAPATVTLSDKGTTRLALPVRALAPGDPRITLNLITPDGARLRKSLILPVRRTDPETATTQRFVLGAGNSFTFDGAVFAGLAPGSGSATLTAGPLARLDMPGLLYQLDRYPYGCTEQLTSAAMPLLYLGAMAQQAGLGAPGDLTARVGLSIDRILARQNNAGGFSLWSAGAGGLWLDAYVTDFLSRARAAGRAVPDRAFAGAMDNLRNRLGYAPDFDSGGADIAYALHVLAREGAASMADLRYYADAKAGAFTSPLAVAQLGAALAAYGDRARADALFVRAGAMLALAAERRANAGANATPDIAVWRDDFGTDLRDAAGVLRLAVQSGSSALDTGGLARSLTTGQRLNTQEAAQVLLAAHALSQPQVQTGLTVDGQPVKGAVVQRLTDTDARAVVVRNTSDRQMDVTLTTLGIPQTAPQAGGYGYVLTRDYYDMQGQAISGPVRSGTRMVVVLNVTPFEKTAARLMVNDPLPAGLEIDNPSLIRSGQIAALGWLNPAPTEYSEFRSDRFLAAVNHRSAAPFQLAYVVRAVTPGVYHHPAATVEDMYRAAYRAHTATGALTVLP